MFRVTMLRSAALVTLAGLAAGCSTDAARLSDSFYRGAVPQNQMQAAATIATPGIDGTSTGSIAPQAGGPQMAAAQGMNGTYAPSASVTRSDLPPPPAASAAYQPVPQPGAPGAATSAPVMAAAPSARPAVAPAAAQASAAPQPAPATQVAAAAQPAPAAASGGPTVTVQQGDSLNAIARRTGVSVADLRAANGLASDNIRLGQQLNLPAGAGNTRVAALGAPPTTLQAQAAAQPAPVAAPAQTPAAAPAAQQPATPAAAATAPAAPAAPAATTVAAETQTAALAPASTGISQFRWPVQGRVVRGFGDRVGSRRSDGVDISVPQGTAVKAAENGVVIYAGEGLKEFGKTVLVKHDNGLVTVYGHADEILVERGATVRRGEDIARAGMTGDTQSPMLHFEVRRDSSPVDPMTYLQ